MRKSSLLISNVAGPIEQMAWANHPIGGFFFTLSGIPQVNLTPFLFHLLRYTKFGLHQYFINAK